MLDFICIESEDIEGSLLNTRLREEAGNCVWYVPTTNDVFNYFVAMS